MSKKVDDYFTIEDSRYTAQKEIEKFPKLRRALRNWETLTHLELVALFEENDIVMRHKPKSKK